MIDTENKMESLVFKRGSRLIGSCLTSFEFPEKNRKIYTFYVPTKLELFTEEAKQKRALRVKEILERAGNGN